MSRLSDLLTETLTQVPEAATDVGLHGSPRRPRGAAAAALLAAALAAGGFGSAILLPPGGLARLCAGLGYGFLAVALGCGLAWAGVFQRPPR